MPADDYRNVEDTPASQRLTNDDFRRLLMTPRSTSSGNASAHAPGSVREAMANASSMPPPAENKGELRRKKKSYYAALKKQEDNKLQELAEKYRDRARERRDGSNNDYAPEDPTTNTSSAYRAVAPDLKSGMDAKERRRQLIQESKFLGGDMEHTHLVKGLDYALLQKVRSEIHTCELEQEAEMERLATIAPIEKEKEKSQKEKEKEKQEEEEIQFKTQMGRDVYNIFAAYRSNKVVRNELFAPSRMAYVIELEEEAAMDTDIPTTLIRSKADVPSFADAEQQTLTTNDIVINKLAQILSYLRHGGRHGKKGKKIKDKSGKTIKAPDDTIYGEIGEYVPNADPNKKSSRSNEFDKERSKADIKKAGSYFEKGAKDPEEADIGIVNIEGVNIQPNRVKSAVLLSRLAAEPEGYAECYPGLREMDDAIDDSDDEVDYSKMDAGNKKGPIGRWDFDTQEEYSAYMSTKEALPKAAFQYGVKTSDGRKTRKTNKEKNDKAELDREWQQIQNIIQKRKVPKDGGEDRAYKMPRY